MSEMIERVARATADADGITLNASLQADSLPAPFIMDRYRRLARAVIEAMREPTEAMTEAANSVDIHGADLHDFVAHGCAGPIYRAMIDEVLK